MNPQVLLAVPLLPLAAAVIAGLGGRYLGRVGAHLLTIAAVAASCVLSLGVLRDSYWGGVPAYDGDVYTWLVSDGMSMHVGFLVDRLSALMMAVVTFVSLCVHVYTIGYMRDDPGYTRFFSYISLFTFSMLMLVMSNNFMQLFFGWEAVGVVSYLLIGFWYTRPSAIFANLKAFIVNRIGDFGFVLGIAGIAYFTNTLHYSEAFAAAPRVAQALLPLSGTVSVNALTLICVCLFVGAMGKSAQVPLHVWLPDSMEGPTPISALIHAATMVTAGIFMVARMSPLFEYSEAALSFVLVIGATTAFFMGLLGVVNNDIKRVIAYSTLSQLGYMTVALGVSAYGAGMFHLMTHAFFKALLFLAAGSVIIGMHHDQDIRNMGGLRKYMPITWITSLLGSLALIGTPFFAGFYSKDSIIEAVGASHLPGAGFALFSVTAGVFVTAFYSFRMYFLVFHGEERFRHKPFPPEDDHAHDDHGDEHHDATPHESPWVVTAPLLLLALPSVVIGYMTIGPMLHGDFFKDSIIVNAEAHPAMEELGKEFHGALAMGLHAFGSLPFWLALAGVVVAWVFYLKVPALPAAFDRALKPLRVVLENKYYFDWFNENVLATGARLMGVGLWKGGDQGLIDGVVINGSARTVGMVAGAMRLVQTGHLYWYALVMLLGIFGFMTWLLWPGVIGPALASLVH